MPFSQEDFREVAKELGRSDEFIQAACDYAVNLQGNGLPVIFSTFHLCLLADIDYGLVKKIIASRESFYKYYEIKKRNGGTRSIVSPYNELCRLQRFILISILEKSSTSKHAFGFKKGKNIKDNAKIHLGSQCVFNIDLFKFFDTITERRVYGLFSSLGFAKNLSVDLAKLVTLKIPDEYYEKFSAEEKSLYESIVRPGEAVLPQGAPTSPYISNLVCRKLDIRLSALAKKLSCQYSRYADDMTFSGTQNSLPYFKTIEKIIYEEGFLINTKKVRLYRKGKRQTVTGLTLSDDVYVNRKFKNEVRKHLYGCFKFGVEEHLRFNKIETGFYKEWLLGKIMFIRSVEPKLAAKFLHIFNSQINWPI